MSEPDKRTILVTGATGYVGGRLVPRLLADGHTVRTTYSDPNKPQPWWADEPRWQERLERVEMDVQDARQVLDALAGVDAAYYLIHGMGGGEDFAETDRRAAQNVAAGVDAHGVERLVYLSGIVPPIEEDELSEHISSRLEVERILSSSKATTITLRAAVLLGSGSTSFEVIRQVSERLPVQTVPTWMNQQVQPIAVVDVLETLVAALDVETGTRSYDVGGPDRMAYADLLDRYSDLAGLTRPQVMVPLIPEALVGTLVGELTDVPASTVHALVESLRHDMVCGEEDFRRDLLPAGHHLLGFEEAVTRSLAEVPEGTEPTERDPMAALPQDPTWAGGGGGDARPLLSRAVDAVRDALPGRS